MLKLLALRGRLCSPPGHFGVRVVHRFSFLYEKIDNESSPNHNPDREGQNKLIRGEIFRFCCYR
jgi:hypothetical protein